MSRNPGCHERHYHYMVTFDRLPELDRMGRPLMFYGQRIHDKCYRRAHFDAGEFVESWDDAPPPTGILPHRWAERASHL